MSGKLHVLMLLCSTLILVIVVGGSYGVTAYLTKREINQELEEAARRTGTLFLDAVYNNIATTTESDHIQQIIRMIEITRSSAGLHSLMIFSKEGTVRQSINPEDVGKKISDVHYSAYLNRDYYSTAEKHRFCLVKPLFNQERCFGCHDAGTRVLGILDVCINMNDVR